MTTVREYVSLESATLPVGRYGLRKHREGDEYRPSISQSYSRLRITWADRVTAARRAHQQANTRVLKDLEGFGPVDPRADGVEVAFADPGGLGLDALVCQCLAVVQDEALLPGDVAGDAGGHVA